jgi:type I restriction enzyme S subunit
VSTLPKNWSEAKIADVIESFVSIDPKGTPAKMFRYVDISSIDNQTQKIAKPKKFRGEEAPSRARRVIRKGDTLFSTVRTYLKNIALVPEELDGELTSTGIAVLRPNGAVDPHYLFNWVTSNQFVDRVSLTQDGTMYPAVSDRDVAEAAIHLPPFLEQRRIVARIDSLSAKSRRAREQLDHIPRLVEKYKQAILAAAFRGELLGLSTVQTRMPHALCWDLPSGWHWAPFPEVATIASNLVKPESIPDLPHIAPDNVESGTGKLLEYRTIQEDGVISPKHRFKPGQIIYSKIRPYLRKAIIVDFDGACSADMYPLQPKANIHTRFLHYWLISEQFASFTVEHEGRTVLPKINQEGLNKTPFPLAPMDAQEELARRIRSSFAWIDRLASEAISARKLIDRLDQAVLAKAFRGELVPQDPRDEPAGVLLERIRAQHTEPSKPNRKRRRQA